MKVLQSHCEVLGVREGFNAGTLEKDAIQPTTNGLANTYLTRVILIGTSVIFSFSGNVLMNIFNMKLNKFL